jgi:hypothetical protein
VSLAAVPSEAVGGGRRDDLADQACISIEHALFMGNARLVGRLLGELEKKSEGDGLRPTASLAMLRTMPTSAPRLTLPVLRCGLVPTGREAPREPRCSRLDAPRLVGIGRSPKFGQPHRLHRQAHRPPRGLRQRGHGSLAVETATEGLLVSSWPCVSPFESLAGCRTKASPCTLPCVSRGVASRLAGCRGGTRELRRRKPSGLQFPSQNDHDSATRRQRSLELR